MNRLRYFTLAVLLLPLASLYAVEVANLRCEYQVNPLGIDAQYPNLLRSLWDRLQTKIAL